MDMLLAVMVDHIKLMFRLNMDRL